MTVHMDADALRDSASEKLRPCGGPHRRPVPDDFMEVAPGRTLFAVRQHYRVCSATALRWIDEAGIDRKRHVQTLSIPEDIETVGPTLHVKGLAVHYGVSPSTIRRWCEEKGVAPAPTPRQAGYAIPADFAETAPRLTRAQLNDRYPVSPTLLMKWCRTLGVEPRRAPYRKRVRTSAPMTASDPSLAAQAAQYLRRRSIVYRCDILEPHERAKLPNRGKGLWYVNGRGAMPADQMIALAETKGFDARAWARI